MALSEPKLAMLMRLREGNLRFVGGGNQEKTVKSLEREGYVRRNDREWMLTDKGSLVAQKEYQRRLESIAMREAQIEKSLNDPSRLLEILIRTMRRLNKTEVPEHLQHLGDELCDEIAANPYLIGGITSRIGKQEK